MESVSVAVGDPCPGGHCEDGLTSLHGHTEQFDGSGPDVPCPRVTEVASDLVHHGPEEDTVVEANIEIQLTLDTGLTISTLCTSHLTDTQGHGTVRQGLI